MITRLVTKLMDWFSPIPSVPQPQDWLADVEADHDAWMPDELWAAHSSAGAPTPSEVEYPRAAGGVTTAPPQVVTAPDSARLTVSAVGGPLKSDEQIIEELVADYREFVRECFRRRP